ncbi:uncharacterized protein L969DRAFT_22364 [Mixia osmundae IAM 14324]|uniref:Ammonium transporter n=1 Tax=Mixia osmundae (strain CBS 9802 / IAM 14324 / JCM 22182 / KY 12970) TaxID=764103 RepID=G7DTV9_MIXOS|nr:uncharacterized protein L969DRAFT_22364 [Mixia osmundae IAM 14324]KEI41733.1 hypothetical protein L969DRAFT_22364 [Mixia osmundae IAM 14324]GAA94019.1 hypothetical protein E5Q_00666 [Mixia osmundae IAM 14324]
MVNITYGVISTPPQVTTADQATFLTSNGTDLITTQADGTIAAFSPGDIAWVLTCTALVWIMIPGLGYLYSGLVRRKNALSMLLVTLLCTATMAFQWFFWGYSLAFSTSSGPVFGSLHFFGLQNVLEQPVAQANNKIPQITYCLYQLQFAALVPAIAIGAAAERGRIAPVALFVFCWSTVVYCPIARQIWSPMGWAYKAGVLDYAGGGPVEICSGTTGLVYSLFLGQRRGFGTPRLAFRPHSTSHVVLGTVFLWVGWLGFNGGSTFAANLKASLAIFNTNLAGAGGGLIWMLMDYRLEKKLSVIGFCTGAISGLVAITPAAGFVGAPASLLIGVIAAAISNMLTSLKAKFKFDDALDIFAVHAVAGAVGLFLTGLFAQASVAANDGYLQIEGGWLDQNYKQLYKQIYWIFVAFGWTAIGTFLVMFVINLIPGMHFRASEDAEIIGMDEDQCNEFCYDFAYVNRDLEGNYNPEGDSDDSSGTQIDGEGEKTAAGGAAPGTGAARSGGEAEESNVSQSAMTGPGHEHDAQKQAWDKERNIV